MKEHPDGRLIVLVGSTGDKAISRRKDFGTVLSELADVAVLTTDDPASEDPAKNLPRNSSPYYQKKCLFTPLDRGEAIAHALSLSTTADDAIVLAGKGADLYQK